MINLKIRINVDEQVLTLPVDTQFIPGIPEKDPVVMVTEITEPEELKYLERDEWNIEELNFLAKRMESFDKREQSQFDAAVSIFRPKTVEALINYTYNLPRFTLISDFSTPNAIGVSHILNRKQVMSLDEMASTDFAKIGKELMQSGKGITTPYCKNSPSLEESKLHQAIVRAINRFNQENETTYRLLMKASLSDALGIGGSNEEMELLTRRIDSLNKKMMALVSEAVAEGQSIDDNEGEFKEISDEIAQLNNRVSAIKELMTNDENAKNRLESINAKVEELKDGITEYDDTIVRQMIECIKVYDDNKIEVIFGGGTSIIEELK
ncbi:MAG: hypothetical protein V8T53_05350 [Eubacteriales bacterium]